MNRNNVPAPSTNQPGMMQRSPSVLAPLNVPIRPGGIVFGRRERRYAFWHTLRRHVSTGTDSLLPRLLPLLTSAKSGGYTRAQPTVSPGPYFTDSPTSSDPRFPW